MIYKFVTQYPELTLLGAITIIQITPLEINPWTWLFSIIRKFLLGDVIKDLQDLKKEISENQFETTRWNVLDFANSCRQGRRHTKEEWDHCLGQLKQYEAVCKDKRVPNGVMEECAVYLRTEYREHMDKNDFLN